MNTTLNYPLFVFLGPPGSGKGTLAQKLSKTLGIPHLSTGDLLRKFAEGSSELAQQVADLLQKGHLVPKEIFLDILHQKLESSDCQNGVVLDGFPRNFEQAKHLDALVEDPSKLVLINVQLPDEVIVQRLTGRRQCTACSKTYHIDFAPPHQDGICDDCKNPLGIRSDDQKEVILKRLAVFHTAFKDLLPFYHARPFWMNVDANHSPEECYQALMQKLENPAIAQYLEPYFTCMKETL